MPRFAPCPLSPQGGEHVPHEDETWGQPLSVFSREESLYPCPTLRSSASPPAVPRVDLGEEKAGLFGGHTPSQVPVRTCAVTRGETAALLG